MTNSIGADTPACAYADLLLVKRYALCKDMHPPTIGVAMIACNNAATIGRALASVQPVAAQIVVVDTGSHDITPTLAARAGAEVYFHRWTDDFSEARNRALEYLRTEWALVLDTDEELDRESFERARHLLTDDHIGGIEVRIISTLEGATAFEHRYTRLVRCYPAIRFCGRIHEQIAGSVRDAGYAVAASDIRILHYGYQHRSAEKIERNITLLEAELSVQPESIWHRYHLGLAEFARGNVERAWALLSAIWHSPELSAEQQELARIRCAQCALAQDDVLAAEELVSFTNADRNREGLRLFVLAGVLAAQRQFRAAADVLEREPVVQSSLVDQQQRRYFAEQLRGLAQRLKLPNNAPWSLEHQWQAIFR
jgi:hypothetical protein